MKISEIQQSNPGFAAKNCYYIRKTMLQSKAKNIADSFSNKDTDILESVKSLMLTEDGVKDFLKTKGITYCEAVGNTIRAASGYNGGFYALKFDASLPPDLLKVYFAHELLEENNSKLGGLLNYKDMISHLKRQDIVRKGMQQHTYELDNNIPQEQVNLAAECLSKMSKKYIKPKKLFFIENEAHYYDALDRVVYSVNALSQTLFKMKPTYRACEFIVDKKGNAIGYRLNAKNVFSPSPIKEFVEQQQPSDVLPEIADSANNKLFAESFRFGNAKPYFKTENAIPAVLRHLTERVGVKMPSREELQFVKFYDKDKQVLNRVCYYDSSTGRSLVYDNTGKYLHQIEYNKDDHGNIVACSKY